MRRLNLTAWSRYLGRSARERGAVAVITALIASFVVLGVLALSVDVGRITFERAQLQNAADATAAELAANCASGSPKCSSDYLANRLESLAGKNAKDRRADMSGGDHGGDPWPAVCFQSAGRYQMPSVDCPNTSYTDLTTCPPLPGWVTAAFPYVETRPHSLDANGDTILPSFFGSALTGGAEPGKAEKTCARATWGPPKRYSSSVPVTFSSCEWKNFMSSTSSVYPQLPVGASPGYGGVGQPSWPTTERVIYFKDAIHTAPCTNSNGKDGPGGFGNVKLVGGVCEATVATGGWLVGENGGSMSNPCRDKMSTMRGTVVAIPVFDCLYINNTPYTGTVAAAPTCNGGSGGTYNYHVAGWAKFYISGYVFPGVRANSYLTGSLPCSTSETCVSGWFVQGELQADAIDPPGGDNDFGGYTILPAG